MDSHLPVPSAVIPLTGLGLTSVGCSDDLMTACVAYSLIFERLTGPAAHTDVSPPVGVARLAVVLIALVGAWPVVAVGVDPTVVFLDILNGLYVRFPALVSPLQRSSTHRYPHSQHLPSSSRSPGCMSRRRIQPEDKLKTVTVSPLTVLVQIESTPQ